MRVRKDQRGFTIVEVLIAMAILSIVVLTVCGFILVGSRSYASANSDINVQQEAQLSLNQMSDVLIDTTRSVNYIGYDAGGNPEKALKDAEFSFAPEDKSLVMFNGVVEETATPGGGTSTTVKDGNGNNHYHFYWSKEAEKLYYAELDVDSGDVDTSIPAGRFPAPPTYDPSNPMAVPAGWVVLASHVTDFSVDLSQVEEKRVVQLALTFLDGRKEYTTSNNVTIRNKVGVNDAELEPLNRKKTLSITPRDAGVILEPGETYHFSTPKVSGTNVADRSVTWSLSSTGSPSGGTVFTDAANGILQVATDEPAGTIDVVITTNAVDDDGNPASCTLTVYIKRVRTVSLSKTADADGDNAANQVSVGNEFTISANVEGEKLGVQCSGCTADITHDHDVVDWRVTQGAEFIDIVETGDCKKDTKYCVKSGTAEGTVIKIAATSELSKNRLYPDVQGEITLTVAKSTKNLHVEGDIQWGVKVGVWADYPSDFNKAGQGYFLIFARVREEGTEGNDKIIAYRTTGWNGEVTPDLFGVEDISKPWYLSLQVLDPGGHLQSGVGPSNELVRDLEQQIHDQRVKDVVADYLANCDSSGTYIGTKYPHTDKFEGRILPPEIFYRYNGQEDLDGELKLKTSTTLAGPWETEFGVAYVKNTRDQRDLGYFSNDKVKFSVYREEDGKLTPIYWYDAKNNNYQKDKNKYTYKDVLKFNEIQQARQAKIRLDWNGVRNQPQETVKAAGKYRIIPTITYVQDPGADTSYTIYYANYQPNYWSTQSYEVPASTVYYELVNGGNLELWSYYNNEFTKGEIYFPTPSDLSQWNTSSSNFDYYFNISDLQDDLSWHDAKQLNTFQKIVKDNNNQNYYQASSIRGRYVKDKKDKNVYEVELFYKYRDSVWGMEVEVSAGVFQCGANGSRWERKEKGTYDSQLENGNRNPSLNATANVNFSLDNQQYNGKMYIPLPSEKAFSSRDNDGFGFALKQSTEQTREWKKLRYQPSGQTNTRDVEIARTVCTYDAATDTYTLKMYGRDNNQAAAFTCKSNGKQWTQS